MNQSRILPFYMAYPLPLYYQQEDSVTRDLEYLQQMYPMEAKKYQKIIAETLDRIDYEGSMIYDEYPDRWQIYRLTQIIVDKIRKTQEERPEEGEKKDADWDRVTEFVQVLLSYEIYRKRHSNRNGILKF
ncbi:MAG: hypothetical protein HDR17_14060 [Lachnospiraceae bacterium]|nr:hypothetical protein [Lachnospiraceae bacterium]MBD5503830.1 hypothetical protein [Lachnospiraceae bacterium]